MVPVDPVDHVDPAVVKEVVTVVAAWYSQEIGKERSRGTIDQEKVARLMVKQRSAARTLSDLVVMGPEELTATGKKYTDLLEVLNQRTLSE